MVSGYEKHKQREDKLKKLAEKPLEELYMQASELEISAEDLLRILAGVQGISPELGKRIDELYNKKFPVPPPPKPVEIPPPTIKECSVFMYIDYMVGKKDKYFSPNHRDVLTEDISKSEYDGALTRVRPKINDIINRFFKNTLQISKGEGLSDDVVKCPKHRTYEFSIVDFRDDEPYYQFQYRQGRIIFASRGLESITGDVEQILRDEGV